MESFHWFSAVFGSVFVLLGSAFVYKRYFTKVTPTRPNRIRYVVPFIDCSAASLFQDMEDTRARPISKLPISVDLPRLARKTIILHDEKLLLDGTDPSHDHLGGDDAESRAKLIQLVWENIATLVEEERDCYSNLSENLRGGDVAAKLGTFMHVNYTDESRVIRVLKVCNQSLLAPAVVRMKEKIGTKFSYKDQRGQWIIVIRRKGDKVTVTHSKKEMSWESVDEFATQHFTFAWSLQIELDLTGERLLGVKVTIDQLEFEETVPLETRNIIVDVFNSVEFIEPVRM